jgi:GntP family gluconate:H+ symporter
MNPTNVAKSITTGFGSTLSSIGIVIGFGVMMGRVLEVSGAAERMAYTFLKIFGKGREELAMALTGYVVSIPIFCDSGFVILSPIAKALSRTTKKSVLSIGVALAVGLVATHHLVPPTPGPLGVAGIFQVDVGLMILWGLLLAIPVTIVGVLYAKWLGNRIYQIPTADSLGWTRDKKEAESIQKTQLENNEEKKLPSVVSSFAPIVVPIILILLNTVLTAMKVSSTLVDYILFFGNPVIAVGIGLIIAIYTLVPGMDRKQVTKLMEEGVSSAGIIILITGAGGALGQVLRDSGAGDYVAKLIAGTGLPAILLPFLVATLVRLVQGSGTVAMITSASITAPILATMHVNPILAAQAACMGAMVFSYFNDSYFWVVNRLLGIEDVREQIMTWSVPTTLGWATGLIVLLIANAIVG